MIGKPGEGTGKAFLSNSIIVSGSGEKHKKKEKREGNRKEKREGNRKRKVFLIDAGKIKL